MKQQTTEKAILGFLTMFSLMIFIVLMIAMCSCSTTKPTQKELFEPEYNYYRVVWCDSNYVYLEIPCKPFPEHKPRIIKNVDHNFYVVGSWFLIEKQNDR